MIIKEGKTYTFVKSGNDVRAIARAGNYLGLDLWEVSRTDGTSAGKTMLVPASALVARHI